MCQCTETNRTSTHSLNHLLTCPPPSPAAPITTAAPTTAITCVLLKQNLIPTTLTQVLKMMKGKSYCDVNRSCGGVQNVIEDDCECASRLCSGQRRISVQKSKMQRKEDQIRRKRLRGLQNELVPTVVAHKKTSLELSKRGRSKVKGKKTFNEAAAAVIAVAKGCSTFTANLRDTTTGPFGSVKVTCAV